VDTASRCSPNAAAGVSLSEGMHMSYANLKKFVDCDDASTAIEYGLIAALVGLGIILSLGNLRDGFGAIVNTTTNGLSGR
jgi:Flp pilus assembly pilin Flp